MKITPKPTAVYAIHRNTPRGRAVVVQILRLKTAELVWASELAVYRAREPISTPFAGVHIKTGDVLILADDASAAMLDAGTVEPVEPLELTPRREAAERRKQSRGTPRPEAGMPTVAGDGIEA